MRGVVIFIVIVTVSSVRSRHPQSKGENNRVKGGTPVTQDFDPNTLGPTKTKKGKRPDRIRNIDVNYIKTVGADIGLRGLAEANNNDYKDYNSNGRPSKIYSPKQTGEPPGYASKGNYNRNGGTVVNNGRSYNTNPKIGAGTDNGAYNNRLNQNNQPTTETKLSLKNIKGTDGNNFIPNKAFMANLFNTLITGNQRQDFKKTTMINDFRNQVPSSEKTAKHTWESYTNEGFNQFNNRDYLRPELHPPVLQRDLKPDTQSRKITKSVSWESLQSQVPTENDIQPKDTSNSYTFGNELQTNNAKQQKTKLSLNTNPQPNQYAQAEAYDPWKPDFGISKRKDYNVDNKSNNRNDNSKTKSNTSTLRTDRKYVGEGVDFGKIKYGNSNPSNTNTNQYQVPSESKENYGTLHKSIQSNSNFGRVDLQERAQKSEKASKLTSQKLAYNKPDLSDYFQSNYKDYNKDVNTGNKKPDLSKPDFGRPDQQNPSKHFNEPIKPVKSDFNFGKPEQPQPAKLDSYSNNNNVAVGNGKPDISQPSFGRPDKHDTSIKGLVNLSKQEKSKTYLKETQYSKSGFKDIGVESSVTSKARLNTNSISDFSNLDQQNANVVFETMKTLYQLKNLKPVHEKFDFGRPEKAEITATNYGKQTKRDYTNSDKQDPLTLDNKKPNNPIPDFGRPVKEETNSKKHESTFNKKQSKPNFGRPDRQEILKKPIQLKADFGRPEAVDSIKPTPGQDNKHFGRSGNPRRPQDKLVPKTISESSKPEFGRPEKTDRKINDNKSRRKGDFFSPDFVKPRRQNAKRKPVKTKAYIGKVENSRIAKQDYETVRKELNIDYKQPDLSTPDFGRPDQQELSSKAHVIDITQKGKPDLSKQDFVGLDTPQPSKQGNDQLPNLNIPMFDFGTPDLRDLKKTSSKAFENTNINNGKPDLSQTKFGRPEKVESTKRIHDKLSKQKVPDFSRPDQQDVSNQNSKANVQNINTYNGNSDLPQPKFETPDRVYLAKQSKDKFPKQTVSTSKFGRREQQDPNLKIYATDPFVNERNLDLTQQTFGIPDKRDPIKQSNDKQSKEKEPKFGFGRSYQQSSNLYVGGLQVNNIKSDLSIPEFGRPDKPDPTKQVNEKRSKPKETTFDIGRQDNLDTANQNLKAFTTDAYKNTVQSDLSQPVFNRLDESVHTKQGYDTFSKQKVQNFNFVRPEQAQLSKTGLQPYATDTYIDKGKPNLSQPDFGRPDKRGPSKEGKRENGQKFDFSSPDRLDVGKKSSTVIAKDIKTNVGKPDMFMPDFGRKWDVPDFSKRGNTNYAKQKVSSFDFGRPDNHDIGKQNLNAYRPDAYVTKGKPDLSKPEFGRPEKTDPSNKGYDTLEKQNPTIFDFGKPQQPDLSKQNLNEFSKNAYSNNGKLDLSKPEFGRPDKPDPTKQGYDTYSKQTGRTDFSRPVSSDTGEQVSKPYAKDANVNNGSPDLTQFTLARSNKPDSTKHLNVPTHDLRRPDQTPNYALENQISKKPESKNAFDYSSLEQHNANILETFKNLYQVKNTQTELNKPDFGRPEMNTNTGATGHERVKTADTINPSYNNNNVPAFDRLGFGRPDKQDTLKQTYGKAITENVSKLDLSRPEKQSKQGSNLNQKAMLISNENLKLAKPDFGRPDKPDPTKMGFDNFSKQKLPNVDFGRPDQLETGKQGSKGYENSPKRQMAESHSNQHQEQYLAYQDSQNSAKDMTADYGKHDSFKADFGRPHKTKQSFYTNSDNAVIDNRNQDLQKPELGGIDESYPLSKKVIERPKFDRTDQPYSGKQGFKTNNNNKAEEYGNIDLAKPDFGRPENPSVKGYRSSSVDTHIGNHGLSRADKSDSSVNSFHISEKKESIKPDFARPDKQDTLKQGHKSSRNNGVADYRKKDMFQPDFGRPDKQNRKIKVSKTHLPIEITKPEFGRPDQIDKTIQNFKGNEIGDYRNIDMSKPDFGRPDLSDPTVEAYPNNVKNGVETIDIGRPDQNQNQKSDKPYKQMIEETPSVIKVKTPDFGRPDKSDITKQSYTISKGSEVNNYRNIDMSKPDFGRPDLSDPTVEAYPNNIKNGVETNGIGRPDQKDMTRQNNKLADNNGDYRNLDIPKQEIRKPDIPKIYVNQYNAPIKTAATTSEFRKLDKSDKQMLVQETPSMKKVKKPEFGRPEQSDVKKQSYTISKGNEVDNYRNIDMSTPDFGRPDLPDPVVKAYPNNFKNGVETIDKGGHDQKDMTRQNYKATSNNGDYRNLDIPKQEIRTPNIPKISVNPYKAPTKTAATTTEFQKSDKPYKQMIEETHSVIKVKTPDFGRPDKSDITKQSYTISKGSEVNNYRNIDMSKPDFGRPDLSDPTVEAYPNNIKNGVETNGIGRPDQKDMTRQNYKLAGNNGDYRNLDIPKQEIRKPNIPKISVNQYEAPTKTAATTPEFRKPNKSDKQMLVQETPSMKKVEKPDFGRPDQSDITKQSYTISKGSEVGDYRNIDMSKPDFAGPDLSGSTIKAYPTTLKNGVKTINQLDMTRQNEKATTYKEVGERRKLDLPKPEFERPDVYIPSFKAQESPIKTAATKPEFHRPDKPDRKVIVKNMPSMKTLETPEYGRPDLQDITKQSFKGNKVGDNRNIDMSVPDFGRPESSDLTVKAYPPLVKKGIKTIDIVRNDQLYMARQNNRATSNNNGPGDYRKLDIPNQDFRIDILDQSYKETSNNGIEENRKLDIPKQDFGRPSKTDQTVKANKAATKTVVTKPEFRRPDKPDRKVIVLQAPLTHEISKPEFGRPDQPDITKPSYKISKVNEVSDYKNSEISKPDFNRPDLSDPTMETYASAVQKGIKTIDIGKLDQVDVTKQSYKMTHNDNGLGDIIKPDKPKMDFGRPEKPDQTITANEAVSKTVVTKPDFERRIEHDILKQNDKISQNDRGENYRKLNIVKPGLSKPDNYDHSMKAYKKLTAKMTEINYSDKTKSAKSKLSRNDRVQKHQELDIPKPDFRRPEKSDLTLKGKPDTTLQSYILPSKTETYNTDFGKHGERNNGATKLPTKANRPFNLSGLDQQKAQSVLQTLKKLYLAKLSNTGTREIDFGRPDQQDLTNINNVNNNKPRKPKPNKPVKTLPDFGKPEKPEQENSNNGKLNPIQARPEYGTLVKQKVTLSNAIKPAHPILTKPDLSRSDRADVINYGSQNDIVPSKPDFGRPDPIERNSSPSSKSIFTKQDFTRPDKPDRARDINDLPRKSVPVNSFFEKHDQTKTKQIPNTKIPNKNLNDLHSVKLDFARPDQSESANPTSKTPDKYIYVRKQELSKPEFSRPDRPDSRKQVNEQLLNTAHVNREQAASVANLAAKPDRNQYSSKTTNSFNFSNLSQQKANLVLQALKKLRLSKDQISTPTKVNKDSPDKHARLFSNENHNKPQASQVYENLDQPGFSKPNAIQISKPDFGRPDELQIPNANDYKRPHSTQSKPDFKRLDKPDVSKQSYETWNKPVRNRPDFARPSQSDRENRNDIPIGNSKPPKTTFERYNKADLSHGQIASYAPVQKSSLVLQKLRKIYQDNQENSNQFASAQQNSFAGWDQLKDSQSSEQVIGSTQKAGLRTTNNLQYNRKSENQATTLLPKNVNTKTRNENDMQNIILPTKLKSGKPYFSERKYASSQGISFKNIPDTRNSFTPEKSENNSPIVSSSNKPRQNANELNKAKKTTVAIKTQPYSSYRGVTSGPRDRVTSAPKVVQPYDSQRHAGVQREVQKPKKPVYDIGKAYSTSKQVAGKEGSKVNCSVIFPICGDDDFTYLSECFLPSTVKKLCNGFCPCAAPGQEAGPATLLVPGSPTSKDSLSKTVANPGKPARIQLFDHNPNKFQNEQTAQSGKQTLESVPRKQSPYKKSSDSLCELKCRGAKLSPVCTTLGITRDNECIQKCRGEITACDGACPCRPDRRDGGLARHLNDKAVFDRNIKDNANMATLGIMSNSDEHGSFDTR